MSQSRAEMDRIVNDHFRFEATDDIEGVLGSLTDDAVHEVVPSPVGALRGRERIRGFYEGLFRELRGEGVTPVRRLYGDDFVVDETIWHGRVEDGRQFLMPGKCGKVSFRLLHVFELEDGKIRNEAVWCDLAAVQRQLGEGRMNAKLRPGTPADAQAAGVICHDAFEAIATRHGFPRDFPSRDAAIGFMTMALARPDVHSVVAEVDGRVAGSNFLWEDGLLASVGPITVDPALQDASIGRAMMQAVLDRARDRGIHSVRLVQAAYHSRSMSLYTKLGFVTREPLVLMNGAPLGARIDGYSVRAATEADLAGADDVCRRVHGHTRSLELRAAHQMGVATIVEHAGRITGYATGVGFFGHAVGDTPEDVKALIAAAPAFGGSGLLVPTRSTALFRWCLESRLRVVQPMTLMSVGPYNEPQGAFLPSILC